jgi:DNA-binding transcriptional LysR family regulator
MGWSILDADFTPNLVRIARRFTKHGPMGDVRLTAPYTFGVTFIAPLLPVFLAAHPGLNVHIELTSRNVDLVEEGFDMAVRIGRPPQFLVAHRLVKNRLRLCASAEYCAQFGEPQTPAELSRHPLLLIGSSRTGAALKLSNGRSRINISTPARLLSSDPSVILQAVKAGAGVGEVPEILAHETLRRGALITLLPGWSLPTLDISLIYPRSRALAPRVKALIDYLRKNIHPGRVGEAR